MEISVDVSKHVVDEIQNIAHSENKDFDVISSKILELGLRIYQSTKNENKEEIINFINENNLPFAEGNAIKYICRHRLKGKKEDILKAIHYLEMIVERDYK